MPPSMPVRQTTPLDPGDPVAQALATMSQLTGLPAGSPAEEHLPAESHIQNLMQNLFHNSIGSQDSSIGMRALAMIGDFLDSPRHAVQSMMGTDQNEMDQAYKQIAARAPAPSTSQLLSGLMSPAGFAGTMGQMMAPGDTGRRWSPETVKIAGDIATDPTSYIGVGLFKSLGKAAAKAGAPVAVQKAFKLAQAGDESAAALLGAVGDLMVKGVQQGLFKLPNAQLAKMFPDLPKWTEYAKDTAAIGDAMQWLEKRGLDLGTIQTELNAGTKTIQDVVQALPYGMQSLVDPAHLEAAVAKMGTTDREAAYAAYKKFLLKDMALDNPARAASFYTHFTEWWKQQALSSLSYVYGNAKGGVLGSLLATGPEGAARIGADLIDNAGNILAGRPFNTQRAGDLANKLDIPIPKSLHEMADNALNATAGPGVAKRLTGSLAGDAAVGAGVGALGAYEDDQNPLLGALAGAGAMAALPKVSARIRKSSQGVETVLREGAWVEGTSKHLASEMANMEKMIVGAVAHGRPGRPIGQRTIDDVEKIVRDANGAVDPQVVLTYLNNRGVPQQTLDLASQALDQAFETASRNGIRTSNSFNFDYQDLSNVERVMTQFFPFSTWYLKAVPFYTKQGFQHPVLAHLLTDKAETSAQMQDERGLPSRFAGTLPNQSQSGLLSMLVGRPLEAFSDPLAALLPFGGASRDLQNLQFENQSDNPNWPKQVLQVLGTAGLNPNPLIATGLQVAGVDAGMNDPSTSSLLRWGGPMGGATALASRGIEAATGQNPDLYLNPSRGVEKGISMVREAGDALTHPGAGRQVQDTTELAIERRVDELALKNTGQPIGSKDAIVAPYVRAKVSKSGPIWKQASAEVHQERGAQSLLGFVSPDLRPDAVLTPQESQIRGAKATALIDPATAHTLDQAGETNPNGLADPKLVEKVRAANQTIVDQLGVATPVEVQKRLDNPTNANIAWVAKGVYAWQVDNDPLFQGYGAGGSPEQRRISNEIGQMSHAGQGLDPGQTANIIASNQGSSLAQGKPLGPINAAKQIPGQERDEILKNDPLLVEYLAWRKLHPDKELADFIAEKYPR